MFYGNVFWGNGGDLSAKALKNMIKKKLKIEGMHCSSCAMLIDGDLEDLEGVKSANTNFAKGETEIEYDDSKQNSSSIVETIKKTGYTAISQD